MRPKNVMVRVFRAVSGQTQRDFAKATGVDAVLLARYERGVIEPGPEHLERLARGAGLTVADGEEFLRYFETLRQPLRRTGAGIEDLVIEVSGMLSRSYQRLLRLPPVERPHPDADGLLDPGRRLDKDPPKR